MMTALLRPSSASFFEIDGNTPTIATANYIYFLDGFLCVWAGCVAGTTDCSI